MNEHTHIQLSDAELSRRASIFKTLEDICQELELNESQYERARQAYEAVARWLAESNDPLLIAVQVYLHGSGALGTTVKPIARDEHDVDLIAFAAAVSVSVPPAELKKSIGDRLKEHKTYSSILEEKKRCWRLNYAGDSHLDISPTVSNPNCLNGGELVPDRDLRDWHPTNPRAYRKLFDHRAEMIPRFSRPLRSTMKDQTSVDAFPARACMKGILRRTVQLLKRHRDEYFLHVTEEIAPISIIVTTLAMRAYEMAVRRFVFDDELAVLVETIRMMPWFVENQMSGGRPFYAVWNETTDGENFADRWNQNPSRVSAFNEWHERALADFEALRDSSGLDVISLRMQDMFGERVVNKAVGDHTSTISQARKSSGLLVAPTIGLTTSYAPAATPVPPNDFFGD